jgi:hypothetical protein
VHLELCPSLSTESFLLAFRRFVARRGSVEVVYSDNAPSLKKASKMMNVTWHFIPERAPFFGGFYERLVKTVKEPLMKVLGRRRVDAYELSTILAEVEAAVNRRPLMYVSAEPEEVLSPAHFLQVPDAVSSDDLQEPTDRRALLRYSREVWDAWRRTYLHTLRKFRKDQETTTPIAVGDVVLVQDSTNPKNRALWPLAKVLSLSSSEKDGRARTAWVQIGRKSFRRAVTHLIPLERPARPTLETVDEATNVVPVSSAGIPAPPSSSAKSTRSGRHY